MKQSLVCGYNDNLSNANTEYNHIQCGWTWNTARNYRQQVMPTSGTLSNLIIELSAQPGATSSNKRYTFTLEVNESDQDLEVEIFETETTDTDSVNSVSVSAGDRVNIQCVPGSTPDVVYCRWSMLFTSDNPKESIIMGGGFGNALDNTGVTEYNHITGGGLSWGTSTMNASVLAPSDGDITAFYVWLSGSVGSAGETYTFTLNNQSGDTACEVVIEAAETSGNWSGSVSVSKGDRLYMQCTDANTPTNAPHAHWGLCFTADTDGISMLMGGTGDDNITAATLEYAYMNGAGGNLTGTYNTTESNRRQISQACTIQNLYVLQNNAPGAGNRMDWTFRADESASELVAQVSEAGTTANDTGSVAIAEGEYVGINVLPVSTPNQNFAASWGAQMFIEVLSQLELIESISLEKTGEDVGDYVADFEDGVLTVDDPWDGETTGGGETAAVDADSYSGAYGAKFTSDNSAQYESAFLSQEGLNYTEVYVRMYVKIEAEDMDTTGNYIQLLSLRNSSDADLAAMGVRYNGASETQWWQLNRNGSSYESQHYSNPVIDQWYCVEIYWLFHATGGITKTWIDGVERMSATSKDTADYGNVEGIRCGINASNAAATIYIDDCVISDSYIGLKPTADLKIGLLPNKNLSDSVDLLKLETEPVFVSRFKTGDLSEWTSQYQDTYASVKITDDHAHHGGYAVRHNYTDNWDGTYLQKTISAVDTVYFRAYFYFERIPDVGSQQHYLMTINDPDENAGILRLLTNFDASELYISWWNTLESVGYNSADLIGTLVADKWYCIELRITRHASAGIVQCWLDGNLIINDNTQDTETTGGYTICRLTINGTAPNNPWIADCVAISESYIGLELEHTLEIKRVLQRVRSETINLSDTYLKTLEAIKTAYERIRLGRIYLDFTDTDWIIVEEDGDDIVINNAHQLTMKDNRGQKMYFGKKHGLDLNNFEIWIDHERTLHQDASWNAIIKLGDVVGGEDDYRNNNYPYISISYGGTLGNIRITEQDDAGAFNQTDIYNMAENVEHYIVFKKVGTTGTLDIYSTPRLRLLGDIGDGDLETQQLTFTEDYDFDTLFFGQSYDTSLNRSGESIIKNASIVSKNKSIVIKGVSKPLTDTINTTLDIIKDTAKVVSDIVDLTDLAIDTVHDQGFQELAEILNETVTLTDTTLKDVFTTLSDVGTLTDLIIKATITEKTDTITLLDTILKGAIFNITDTVNLTDTIIKDTVYIIAQLLSLTDSIVQDRTWLRELVESITGTSILEKFTIKTPFTDIVNLTGTIIKLSGSLKILSETITLTEDLIFDTIKDLDQILNLTETFLKNWTSLREYTETITLTSTLARLRPTFKIFSDTITLADTITKLGLKYLTDDINLADTYIQLFTVYRVITENPTLIDTIQKFTTLFERTDTVNLTGTYTPIMSFMRSPHDTLIFDKPKYILVWDDEASFWTYGTSGSGTIGQGVSGDNVTTVFKGILSAGYQVISGSAGEAYITHDYGTEQDWRGRHHSVRLFIKGGGTAGIIKFRLFAPDADNYLEWDIPDNKNGWMDILLDLQNPDSIVGESNLANVTEIRIVFPEQEGVTFYVDRITRENEDMTIFGHHYVLEQPLTLVANVLQQAGYELLDTLSLTGDAITIVGKQISNTLTLTDVINKQYLLDALYERLWVEERLLAFGSILYRIFSDTATLIASGLNEPQRTLTDIVTPLDTVTRVNAWLRELTDIPVLLGTVLKENVLFRTYRDKTQLVAPDPASTLRLNFEENFGNIVYDKSSYTNDGTIYNGTWGNGKQGKAITYNGASTYIDCGADDSITPTGAFTVSAYIYLNAWHATYNAIVVRGSGSQSWNFLIRSVDKLLYTELRSNGITRGSMVGTTPLELYTWYHVVFVFDGMHRNIYLNGKIDKAGTNDESGTVGTAGTSLTIGKWVSSNYYFNGIIDDVLLYQTVFTAGEVKNLYDVGENYLTKEPGKMLTQPLSLISDAMFGLTDTFNEIVTLTANVYTQRQFIMSEIISLISDVFTIRGKILVEQYNLSDTFNVLLNLYREPTETINLIPTFEKIWDFNREYSENITLSDTLQQLQGQFIVLSDTFNLVDTWLKDLDWQRILSNTTNLTDTATIQKNIFRTLSDTVTLLEEMIFGHAPVLDEIANLTDIILPVQTMFRDYSDILTLTGTVYPRPLIYLNEALSLSETIIRDTVYIINQQLSLTDYIGKGLDRIPFGESITLTGDADNQPNKVLTNTLTLSDIVLRIRGKYLTETITTIEAPVEFLKIFTRNLVETPILTDTVQMGIILYRIYAELVRLTDSTSSGFDYEQAFVEVLNLLDLTIGAGIRTKILAGYAVLAVFNKYIEIELEKQKSIIELVRKQIDVKFPPKKVIIE